MKTILFFFIAAALVMAAIYFTLGGPAMAVAMIALAGVALLIAGVTIGSGWSAKLMERGAAIALQAQVSDDRRDIALIRGIVGAGKALGDRSRPPQYPALPFGESRPPEAQETQAEYGVVPEPEFGFVIDGFENSHLEEDNSWPKE